MLDFLLSQQGSTIYLIVALMLLGGAFLLPFPEDLILIAVGVLIHNQLVDPLVILLITYCSILIADAGLYLIGYSFGMNLFSKRWFRNRIPPQKIKRIRGRLEKRAVSAVFCARHLFYLRTITFICCGAVRVKFSRFILADALAALVSTTIFVTIGYFAAQHISAIEGQLGAIKLAVFVLTMIFLGFYIRKRILRKHRRQDQDASSETSDTN